MKHNSKSSPPCRVMFTSVSRKATCPGSCTSSGHGFNHRACSACTDNTADKPLAAVMCAKSPLKPSDRSTQALAQPCRLWPKLTLGTGCCKAASASCLTWGARPTTVPAPIEFQRASTAWANCPVVGIATSAPNGPNRVCRLPKHRRLFLHGRDETHGVPKVLGRKQ